MNLPNPSDDDVFALRKQMRYQEAEWKKNKAVLEQRIEILEMQNQELKEREEQFKKMNSSIMTALNDLNKENDPSKDKMIRELERAKDQLQKDYSEFSIRTQENIKSLERDNKEYREKVSELENKYNHSVLQYEKSEMGLQQKCQNLESEKKNLTAMLGIYDEENKKLKERQTNEAELHSKIGELRFQIEKQKEDGSKEIDRIHKEYQSTIKKLKKLVESEKIAYEKQLEKIQEATRSESKTLEEAKKIYQDEITTLKKDRDELRKRIEIYDEKIENQAELARGWEEKFHQTNKENEVLERELKKYRAKTTEIEYNILQLKKSQQTEKVMKQLLDEKEQKVEEAKQEFRKKMNAEKKKTDSLTEVAKKAKEDEAKKYASILQECLKKDEIIKKLKTQLKTQEKCMKSNAENELMKSNTSLNFSIINNSVSALKAENNTSLSHDLRALKKISNASKFNSSSYKSPNLKDNLSPTQNSKPHITVTSEDTEEIDNNILMNLNSPRAFNCTSSYQFVSGKKDFLLSTHRNENKNDITENPLNSSECNDVFERYQEKNNKESFAGLDHSVIPQRDKVLTANPSTSELHHLINEIAESAQRGKNISQAEVNNIIQNIRKVYEDRIRELEERLRDSEVRSDKFSLERDKLQVELDRLILELKQTKMEWALSEEKKEESELALKNEIKFLINKLLKIKGSASTNDNSILAVNKSLNRSINLNSSFASTSAVFSSGNYNNFGFLSPQHDYYNSVKDFAQEKKNQSTERKLHKYDLKPFMEEPESKETTPNPVRVNVDLGGNSPNRRVSEFPNNENKVNAVINNAAPQKKMLKHIKI